MSGVQYAPVDQGEVISSEQLAPGTLAYMAGQKQPILILSIADDKQAFLELGGDRSMAIWDAEDEDCTAWTVPDWRLEVDPTSMVDGRYASLLKGYAFRHGDRAGLVGVYNRNRPFSVTVPVGTDGASKALTAVENKAFFSRWRIVVPSADGDRTLVDDEGKAQPR